MIWNLKEEHSINWVYSPKKVPIQKVLKGTEHMGEAKLTNQLGNSGDMRRNRK